MTSPKTKRREPGKDPVTLPHEQADVTAENGTAAEEKWAICCSGGGVRSAAYSLGALQSMQQDGLLKQARWILGVSGGSYIAASRALVAHHLPKEDKRPAYAPGTPEERNLRLDTGYIAPDGPTVLVGVLSLLLGVIFTFIIALAPVYALAHAWGWLLRLWGAAVPVTSVPSGEQVISAHVISVHWLLPSAIMAGITLALFMFWWWTLHPYDVREGTMSRASLAWLARHWPELNDRDRGANRAKIVSLAAILTAGLAVAMLAVPPLISWLNRSNGPLGTIAQSVGFGGRPTWSLPTLAALISAVAAVAKYSHAGLAKWSAMADAAQSQSAPQPGLPAKLGSWLRQRLMPWVASAVVVLFGLYLALLWTTDGVRAGFTKTQLWYVLGALAVMLFTRIGVNINRLSMHNFYRWRLADAFAVTRQAAEARHLAQARPLFNKASATRFSELRHKPDEPERPELVICGTANINAAREVPRGQDGFCIAIDADNVTLRREQGLKREQDPKRKQGLKREQDPKREQDLKDDCARALTSDYEALIGVRRCTLFDVTAISGAAVSPLMGAATRHAYRILFTFTNVCLGVWLPHPKVVHGAREQLNRLEDPGKLKPGKLLTQLRNADQEEDKKAGQEKHKQEAGQEKQKHEDRWWAYRPLLLLLWYLSPHPLRHTYRARIDKREARLWAHALERRLSGRWRGAFWYRLMQPALGLLWTMAAGRLSYRDTWMYVTDGGHYDNLGLVEALHRGADRIVVLDASGDKADTWFTLGGAIALARADAGVDIKLNPTTMFQPGLAPGEVVQPWAYGTFTRANPEDGLPRHGRIWVCKLGWWKGAPWDVLAYARSHPTFPCDSTVEQLYDAMEFEAYHQLGATAAAGAAEHCKPPLRPGTATGIRAAPTARHNGHR